jgi:hypothetical protein
MISLTYAIEVESDPARIWPWIIQMGYHRGGWYIDKWWDRFEQEFFWPRFVPKEVRGTYRPPADRVLPEYQSLKAGDTIPDGPPGSAFYAIRRLEADRLLLLHSTSHFKYMVPAFLIGSRFEPFGEFSWAFLLEPLSRSRTRVTSRWRGTGGPRLMIRLLEPLIRLADHLHQPEILRGLKRRVEADQG